MRADVRRGSSAFVDLNMLSHDELHRACAVEFPIFEGPRPWLVGLVHVAVRARDARTRTLAGFRERAHALATGLDVHRRFTLAGRVIVNAIGLVVERVLAFGARTRARGGVPDPRPLLSFACKEIIAGDARRILRAYATFHDHEVRNGRVRSQPVARAVVLAIGLVLHAIAHDRNEEIVLATARVARTASGGVATRQEQYRTRLENGASP